MDDEPVTSALAPLALPGLANAAGTAEVFKATREFVTEHLKPNLIEVTDPDTGIKVLAVVGEGSIEPVGATFFDNARDNPRFRRGTAAMTSLDSFIAHLNRFGDADSAVFADDSKTSPKLTAVIDYHRADTEDERGEFRHGKHRTTFAFPVSEEWKAWTKTNGTVMTMGQFALFLEDRIGDIAIAGDEFPEDITRFVNVNGGIDSIADFATLVELSRGLKVYEQANVEEATNLASGEGHIRFSVEHQTKTRTGGSVKVPTMFFIAIPVFAKGPFYRIGARLRYRKTAEGVKFWYDLYRADRSFDHAFEEAVAKVEAQTPAAVFFGASEGEAPRLRIPRRRPGQVFHDPPRRRHVDQHRASEMLAVREGWPGRVPRRCDAPTPRPEIPARRLVSGSSHLPGLPDRTGEGEDDGLKSQAVHGRHESADGDVPAAVGSFRHRQGCI